ncbi:MAG: hypothetical protein FWH17_00620 [Oscillospiraceae bacterium]|nr:hypothetical protein [Oscillospiraceae bacterium]
MFDDKYNGLTVDEAASKAGGYVAFQPKKNAPHEYDYRSLSRYCRERGVEPLDLPEDELSAFRLSVARDRASAAR